jgi:D-inositol-3-phosphate glycosyltransferase
MISLHTSPLEQPGTGDAGGLNVYVVEVARRLAERGTEVDIFTRAVSRDAPPVAELAPGVLVRHVAAGPFEDLDKADLPGQLCQFTFEVLRAEAAYAPGRYDLVHGHYWLSGQVGKVAKERWGIPLVQSMHTLGRVKNAALAAGDAAEPDARIRGEVEVVAAADCLVANTDEEAAQLTGLYDADPARVATVNPGVDLAVFSPGSRLSARRRLDLPQDAVLLVFAGRVQPLKAPDVVLRAAARLIRDEPALAGRVHVAFVGGPSGTGRADPDSLRELAAALGVADAVRLPAAGTGGLVPGRHGGHGAVLLRVVRPGRGRGAGLRHAGDRRLGGRAAHRGARRGVRDADRRALPGRLRPGHQGPGHRPRPGRPAVRGGQGARVPVQLGRHGRRAPAGIYLCHDACRRPRPRGSVTSAPSGPAAAIEKALAGLDLGYESPRPGAYLVRLPGQHKLATMTWLIVGAHSLHVEAFFCRQPDENHAAFYRFLLERGGRMFGVHFALDETGDVYLVGRLPLASISPDEIDRILGCVLEYSDSTFDQALMLGFASAIRKERAWRIKRGESLANLQAFARLADGS